MAATKKISDFTADSSFPADGYYPVISATLDTSGNYKQQLVGRINTMVGATLADGDLGTFSGSTITNDSSVKTALQELETAVEARATSASLAATGGSALVGFLQSGSGAVASTVQTELRYTIRPEQFGAVGDGVTNDASALQAAVNAAVTNGRPLVLQAGKTYLIGTGLTTAGALTVIGNGAKIKASAQLACFSLKSNSLVRDVRFEGPSGTYDFAGRGIYAEGTRNGAGVAPTFATNIRIENCTAENFGNSGFEFRYCKDVQVINPVVRNVGLHGVLGFASENIVVVNPDVDGVNGDGSLNAYGVGFTSDTSSTDRVRDPKSKRCFAFGGVIKNIPTWHGVDMHGGDTCGFYGQVIINCRRAAVMTALPDVATNNSFLKGIRAYNFYAATEKNSNGTFKKSEAFWDIGLSSGVLATGNAIEDCYSYAYGAPDSAGGATIVQYTSGGLYQRITDEAAYNSGLTLADYAKGVVRDCTSINVRGIGVGATGVVATLNGTTTLNVTTVGAGTLRVGHFVSGTGIPANTYISALGTGVGGTGTYIMSQAATTSGAGVAVTVAGSPQLSPTAIYVSTGDYQNVDIIGHQVIRSNGSLDVAVAVYGAYLETGTANRTVRLRGNNFAQALTSPIYFAGSLTGYTGDYSVDVTYTMTGVSGTVTGIGKAYRNNDQVTLNLPALTGTSNATSFTLTGLFTNFAPIVARNFTGFGVTDNGTAGFGGVTVETTGVITVKTGFALSATFTGSGTKAIAANTITYPALA